LVIFQLEVRMERKTRMSMRKRSMMNLPLVIFQLEVRMERKTRMSMRKRSVMEQTMPSLRTGTDSMNTTVYRNQGSGNLHIYRANYLTGKEQGGE
jgi:hypothetical protein